MKATTKSLMDLHPRELKGLVYEIPTLPVIYQELFEKMQDPDTGVPELAEIIARDQALTAKVLHLVNSAFYGPAKEIMTVSRAVVVLGFQAVRSAALAISVFDYFGAEESTDRVDMASFWRHSIAVAAVSKALAGRYLPNQQEEAFIVGLLHDVGKLIEKRHFAEDFADVCQAAQEHHLSWIDCERELFRLTHATIGKAVFRAWRFPPAVVEAVQYHHTPSSATGALQLTALVHVADYVAYELGHGAPGAFPPETCDRSALKLLGADLDDIALLQGQIEEDLVHSMELLKLVG
ncbi:MAG: HDOD domain-containing protein [bacterium]|nr:HDOD domain-containing protein [bacterium]